MRVHVDSDYCGGHGVCVTVCPDMFELTDDGYARATVDEVPHAFLELVLRAARECPSQAIVVQPD
jgi:ferredoxin